MHAMNSDPWVLAGVLAYSITVTLVANWLVTGFERPTLPRRVTLECAVSVLANLLWILVVSVFGVLATRYVERMTSVVIGYTLFGMLGLLISWARACLYRRAQLHDLPCPFMAGDIREGAEARPRTRVGP